MREVYRRGKRFLHAGTGPRGVLTGDQVGEASERPMSEQVMTDDWDPCSGGYAPAVQGGNLHRRRLQ